MRLRASLLPLLAALLLRATDLHLEVALVFRRAVGRGLMPCLLPVSARCRFQASRLAALALPDQFTARFDCLDVWRRLRLASHIWRLDVHLIVLLYLRHDARSRVWVLRMLLPEHFHIHLLEGVAIVVAREGLAHVVVARGLATRDIVGVILRIAGTERLLVILRTSLAYFCS